MASKEELGEEKLTIEEKIEQYKNYPKEKLVPVPNPDEKPSPFVSKPLTKENMLRRDMKIYQNYRNKGPPRYPKRTYPMDGYKPMPIPEWKDTRQLYQNRAHHTRPHDVENDPINPIAKQYFFNNCTPHSLKPTKNPN